MKKMMMVAMIACLLGVSGTAFAVKIADSVPPLPYSSTSVADAVPPLPYSVQTADVAPSDLMPPYGPGDIARPMVG